MAKERRAGAVPDGRKKIDGFHLVIEALKLNGIDTVFGLPGIRSPT
jgi:hypothetical protein